MNFFAKRHRSWLLLILALMLMGGAGCGATKADSDKGEGLIVIVDFAERKVSFDQPPERIVALGNGEVDIIYALGGKVVGRPATEQQILIEAAYEAEEIGSVHTVDLEKIASLKPDVVLGNYPLNINDVQLLEGIGTRVILTHANSIDDIRKQIRLFGDMLEQADKADRLLDDLHKALTVQLTDKKFVNQQKALLVYGAPGTYLAALPNSLAGNILEEAGGINVAAQFSSLQNFPQYAQLNSERIVQSEPDVILIMTHGSTEEVKEGFLREMEGNPAWNSMTAVKMGRIYVLPAELFGTNPGTRVVESVHLLQELLGT